tara:strand:- start:3383 stop:5152 length:1770 start_codon:yes stop_codon:yes gene_type:complete
MTLRGDKLLVKDILDRTKYLKAMHDQALPDRARFRAIINGGEHGIKALLGQSLSSTDADMLPAPNLLLSALDRLAQKIGRVPALDVHITNPRDSERNKKKKDKLERIVTSYDQFQQLELQLPQVARWLPGYGFAVWVITTKTDPQGHTFPVAELRDPYTTFPGYQGANQMAEELVSIRNVPVNNLIQMYPELKSYFAERSDEQDDPYGFTVGLYNNYAQDGSWENSNDNGELIVEYINPEGTYIVHVASQKIVDFVPNPLKSGPAFVCAKRYSFDQIQGQFDQVIGLMAAMAKINVMSVIAMEDAVFTETNIVGEIESGQYRKGRNAINYLTPGSQVIKPVNNLPYQLFESVSRIERHLRTVAGYPVSDDAISPNSFVTGRGLEELNAGIGAMVNEYHKVLQVAIQEIDYKRLELDELVLNKRKPLVGTIRGAAFAENYTPKTDIDGNYLTRRKYGAMATFDEASKVITGLQLLQAGIIDKSTMQREMDGLEDLQAINERITKDKAESVMFDSLLAQATQGDPKASMALVEIYNKPNQIGTILKKFYTAEEPEPSQQEAMMAQMLGQGGPPQQGPPPSPNQVLQLLGGG